MVESRSEDILAVTLGLESSEVLVPPESRVEDYLQQLLEKMKHIDGKTAYEYAVEKGYTGTEEQFASMMASYATVAEQATDAADRAITAVEEVEDAVDDIEVLQQDVSELKSAITTIENYVGEEKPEHLTLVSGGMNNATGKIYADNTRAVSKDFIYLETGDVFSVDSSAQYVCCRYNATGIFQEAITPNGYTGTALTVATTGFYKFGLRLKNEQSADISGRLSEVEAKTYLIYVNPATGMNADILNLQNTQNTHESRLDAVEEQVDKALNKVISDRVITITKQRDSLSTGYVVPNGTVVSSSSIRYINIPAIPGDIVSVKRFYINSSGVPAGIFVQNMNAICAYNGAVAVAEKGRSYNANLPSYTVPDGIDNVTISFTFSGTYDYAYIIRTLPDGQTNYYPVGTVFENPLQFKGNLSANVFQQIGQGVCVDEYVASLICPIGTGFTSIKFGGTNAGGTAVSAPYIEVTNTQVKMFSNTSSEYNRTADHGLDNNGVLENDLQIIIIAKKDSLYFDFIVQSNGKRWTSPNDWRFGTSYYGFGVVSESAITGVDISVSVRDLHKPVWVCGDSWVTNFESRWYGQAISLNLVNFLHSGHSGEGSTEGLVHLKTLLSMYTPKMVVWLYGMNDIDTNNSTPNAGWLAALNELKTICENMTIDLVLATIPTTPSRNMNAKNAVVTASGYRYVDEVAAMGADTSGNWIAGYQSQDGDHTTAAGARALLAQVLADVPEIALK